MGCGCSGSTVRMAAEQNRPVQADRQNAPAKLRQPTSLADLSWSPPERAPQPALPKSE